MTTKEYYKKRDALNDALKRAISLNMKNSGEFLTPRANKLQRLMGRICDRLWFLDVEYNKI